MSAQGSADTGSGPGARPLRLLCYIDAPVYGGSAGALAMLLSSLDPAIDVTLVGTAPEVVERVGAARDGITVETLPKVRNKADLRAIVRHLRLVRRLRPDVLHANLDHQWGGQYGILAGLLSRTPVVAMVHAVWPHPDRLQRALIHALAKRVDTYVAVSAFVARSTELLLGLAAGEVRVIYNGVPPAPPLASRRESVRPVVGAVGRLSFEKGIDTLVRAVEAVPDCDVVIVGDGPDRPELEALSASLGVADRVTFAGWVDPPWTSHWTFDLLAMPSHYEGFPLVLLEAMQAGIPVVASAVGGIPEMIVDGHDGVLVPPQDPHALAAALKNLLDDTEGRQAMATRARSVAERFTTARMAEEFEALYREAASKR